MTTAGVDRLRPRRYVRRMNPTEFALMLEHIPLEPAAFRDDVNALLARYAVAERAAEVLRDAVGRAVPGFANGWVSCGALERRLRQYDVELPPSDLVAVLERAGHVRHPVLTNGRTNNPVRPDGNRARLYVVPGHTSLEHKRARDVERQYEREQGHVA